ncbi:ferrous iron transport protein B [Sulfobacillus harzensis]|uniref:Ferrous iron transport protein B n=1 Tax=Sulfobacillus harzensis TaxID=2729629 RepID=A0A7Y0Q450_9FIRM|nr:ferrous iron transport protein B [Sulfobacillus harzensis]NMP24242.1 ferrous iron transport protein B [Sulfobacillus harzensis]
MARRTIVLAGNPNVGKSMVFTQLTGRYAEVSNFPGTTVEMLEGWMGPDRLVDTPGIYGLSRFNDEERVALQAIREADLVVQVLDSTHLPRDLFLTWHLIDAGVPLVVAVNMIDELHRQEGAVDTGTLEEALDVPVVAVSGLTGEGLSVLRALVEKGGRVSSRGVQLDPVQDGLSRLDRLLWHEQDADMVRRVGQAPPAGSRSALYSDRRQRADRTAEAVFSAPQQASGLRRWLGQALLTPWGSLLSISVLLMLVYYLVGVVVADVVVSFLEGLMTSTVIPALAKLVGVLFHPGSIVYRLLVGQYGLISAGLIYLVALLLPLIVAFYLLLAALEDSGYLPRLATMLDRFFLRLGLNGRAVIPLVLGFGCVTMATVTTRILSSDRERTIATILLAWTIPCSAQMGVITGLLAGVGWQFAVTYALVITGLFVLVGTLLDRTLPGKPTPLLLDLPPLRMPSVINMLEKTRVKVAGFLREAGPLFLIGSGIVELSQIVGLLPWLVSHLTPFMQEWLGIPGSAVPAFVLGFIRRDFGAAGLYAAGLTPHQILTGAVTLTLFVPCIASTLVILKERGWRSGSLIWLGSIALALLVGGLTARLGPV